MEMGVVACFLEGVVATSLFPPVTVAVIPDGGDLDPNFAPLEDPRERATDGAGDEEEDFLVVAGGFPGPRPPVFFPGRVLSSSSSPSSSIFLVPS